MDICEFKQDHGAIFVKCGKNIHTCVCHLYQAFLQNLKNDSLYIKKGIYQNDLEAEVQLIQQCLVNKGKSTNAVVAQSIRLAVSAGLPHMLSPEEVGSNAR